MMKVTFADLKNLKMRCDREELQRGEASLHTEWSDIHSTEDKDTISAGEQHTSPDHLSHNAAHWPYVHWWQTFRWQEGRWTCKHNDEDVKKWEKIRNNNKENTTQTEKVNGEGAAEKMEFMQHQPNIRCTMEQI